MTCASKSASFQVSLVVNVASQCGYTDSHYKELVALQAKYPRSEFNVLAFPCNQFGKQEPDSVKKIVKSMTEKYGVNFPIFDKINVKDDETGYADPAFSNLICEVLKILLDLFIFFVCIINNCSLVIEVLSTFG